MKDSKSQPPQLWDESFSCPHCNVLAVQNWHNERIFLEKLFSYQYQLFLDYSIGIADYRQEAIKNFLSEIKPRFLGFSDRQYIIAECTHCKKFSIWIDKKMVYPLIPTSLPPNEDMPEDVKKTYEEARQVQPFSVRASAALLRVALEQLTAHLGEKKGTLNTKIKNLKKKGLSVEVIQILDIVRIYGNEGGNHVGVIDLEDKDNEDTVDRLFKLVNSIVSQTISIKKDTKSLLEGLPQNKKEGIKNRDSNKKPKGI